MRHKDVVYLADLRLTVVARCGVVMMGIVRVSAPRTALFDPVNERSDAGLGMCPGVIYRAVGQSDDLRKHGLEDVALETTNRSNASSPNHATRDHADGVAPRAVVEVAFEWHASSPEAPRRGCRSRSKSGALTAMTNRKSSDSSRNRGRRTRSACAGLMVSLPGCTYASPVIHHAHLSPVRALAATPRGTHEQRRSFPLSIEISADTPLHFQGITHAGCTHRHRPHPH